MYSKYISILLVCLMPCLSNAQHFRNITTQAYQQQVQKNETTTVLNEHLPSPLELSLVFHLFYSDKNTPPSEADVQWQIDQLNKHFSLAEFNEKQAEYGESNFDHLAIDTEISFCGAKIFLHPTNGDLFPGYNTIKQTDKQGAAPYKPAEYINIWVGDLAQTSGYTQLPGGVPETDGIVIDVNFFGRQNAPYNEGKTLTHLMGNYLGLSSLWGSGNCEDDGVKDTPVHNAPNHRILEPGARHISLCPGFKEEMYMNYMDNTIDEELYLFTAGQKQKMHETLRSYRNGLLTGNCSSAPLIAQPEIELTKVSPQLVAYPNPTFDQVTISFEDAAESMAILKIHNVIGELIYSETIYPPYQKELSLKDWQPGIYMLTVDGSETHTLKVVKQ